MTQLSDKAVLVHLAVSQWVAKKLDRTASNEIARLNGAVRGAGNYNKSLLPTCAQLDKVKQETALIRKTFYQNTLPWGIQGTYILPSSNYLAFMAEYRQQQSRWWGLVNNFLDDYEGLRDDAERLLGTMYNPSEYPTLAELEHKFSMDLTVLPVPTAGDFRVELIDAEYDAIRADLEERVAESSKAAARDVWQRLYDKVAWLHGRMADVNNTFHDQTFIDARELVSMLGRLNFMDDPELEGMRQKAEALLMPHPQTVAHDPELRSSTADEAKAIMDKMRVFMEGV